MVGQKKYTYIMMVELKRLKNKMLAPVWGTSLNSPFWVETQLMPFGSSVWFKLQVEPLHSKSKWVYCATRPSQTVLIATVPYRLIWRSFLACSVIRWCSVACRFLCPCAASVIDPLCLPSLCVLGIGIEYIRFPVGCRLQG